MSFAFSTANDLGIGKVLDTGQDSVRIEYFSSPCRGLETVEVKPRSVTRVELDQQTRVYYLDPASQVWRTARSLVATAAGQYIVAFPNRDVRSISCEHLFVRCNRPIGDPIDFLAGRVTETPYLHVRRNRLVAALFAQRAASAGMTGLLSAGIELEPHQIEVVRRVLQDPVQRYLLADEVGLGKTIEAGAIIRQFVLDDPAGHRVLITVPPHLVAQWREELVRRFSLAEWLDRSVRLVAFDAVETALAGGRPPRLLVVDEAHQLAAMAAAPPGTPEHIRFHLVREAATRADQLLLLSATPSLHNEAGFQAMLHLLDPVVYPLGNLDAFRARRDRYQQVAELFHVFHPTESGAFLGDCLDDLTSAFPSDARLGDLAARLRPLLDYGQDPADDCRIDLVREIRCHLSEVYRLHRRLLRNRRADPRVEPVLPGRDGLELWDYEDPADGPVSQLLEEWRAVAAGVAASRPETRAGLVECLRLFWEAASDPMVLAILAAARRGEPDEEELSALALTPVEKAAIEGTTPLPDEDEVLRRVVDAAGATESLSRADAVADGIAALWQRQPDAKVVVFAIFPRTADEIRDVLKCRWRGAVVRHGEVGWEQFRIDPNVRVLLCDRSAEEGLNLQGGRVVLVHFDLPLSPNRVEQRLGRIDRYGIGRAVRSVAAMARGAEIPRAWCGLLDASFRVFDRSIAALQYLVEGEMPAILDGLLFEGADGLRAAADWLGGRDGAIEEALRRIQVLDELDAVETSHLQQDFADRLILADQQRSPAWQDAFRGWVVERLKFFEWPAPWSDGKVVRYQFRRPKHQGEATLVPVGRLVERFRHVIDDEETQDHPLEPITHKMTFSRPFARARGISLARAGHPFLDAMADYLDWDDSGVSFGLWRLRPAHPVASPPADLAFRFDFLIEGRIDAALDALPGGSGITRQVVRRLADRLLPPEFLTVWIDESGELLTDPARLGTFAEPYLGGRVEVYGTDFNLNPDAWQAIEPLFPASDWQSRVRHARGAADRVLDRHLHAFTQLADRVRRARVEADTRRSQAQSRVAFLPLDEAEIERRRAADDERLWAALVAGVERPSVRLDALGAVFVSGLNPFIAEA
jgi:ATP-dependent helicase HepA